MPLNKFVNLTFKNNLFDCASVQISNWATLVGVAIMLRFVDSQINFVENLKSTSLITFTKTTN